MSAIRFFIALLFVAEISPAQNLIPNPGFENYSMLPTNYGQFNLATGWNNCNGAGTPDYFHTLGTVPTYFGTNLPHSGDGMAGFCPFHGTQLGFREYLDVPLTTAMVSGQTYSVSFWLATGINGGYGYGCNNIGVTFSVGPLTQFGSTVILDTPQVEITNIFYDTLWTLFSFQYTATAAYDHFTIGNFRDDAVTQTAQYGVAYNAVYYFVDDITVEVSNQPPIAVFNAPNHICPGTCTAFINLSQYATSYLWSFPGAVPSTSTDVSPANICYNAPGVYTVSLIATNTITSDTLTLTNYITVYPYPPPQGILQSGDTLFANQGAVTYQWYLNGNLIPGATNYFFVAPQSGDYNVVCTDANGCEVEAVIFNVIAGLEDPGISNGAISIYPNPGSLSVTILSPFNIDEITLFNSIGEEIHIHQIQHQDKKAILNTGGLANGVYMVSVRCDEKSFRGYFIKK